MRFNWTKQFSILVLSLFILAGSNLLVSLTFSNLESSVERNRSQQSQENEPAEKAPTEQGNEKSEFITNENYNLTTCISLFTFEPCIFNLMQLISRCIAVLTPPPNAIEF